MHTSVKIVMSYPIDRSKMHRPMIMSTSFMVSSGHYHATLAGIDILEKGGNAFDAGVAVGLCINVTHPDFTNLGGVAPIIIYSSEEDKIYTISGLGTWPEAEGPGLSGATACGRGPSVGGLVQVRCRPVRLLSPGSPA